MQKKKRKILISYFYDRSPKIK